MESKGALAARALLSAPAGAWFIIYYNYIFYKFESAVVGWGLTASISRHWGIPVNKGLNEESE